MTSDAIADRLAAVRGRIAHAAARAGRDPAEVTLVGVSKGKSAEQVVAAARAGLAAVGENYVQEAVPKIEKIRAELAASGTPVPRWHFIGTLQRNKARPAVRVFDMIETLDRESLGAALEGQAVRAERSLEVLVQVNLSGEPQKRGAAARDLRALLEASRAWPHLRLAGLMSIPAPGADPETSRPAFAKLRELAEQLRAAPGGSELRELSMGMSADFEVAVEEGATLVRVGTAIFGPRKAAKPPRSEP